ncbi:MAG TPA: HipA family kinase [Vicinamibacterales bacterium]
MRTVSVTRYVTPLREGGSLPGLVEADDEGLYVLKFSAAGHGVLALVAELVSGEIARTLGLPVPELVLARLDAELARTEPDPEIHALIHDSAGLNLALDFLPGSVNFDPLVHALTPALASRIVWLDGFVSNVDRTARNTNMLMWHRTPWLIDHGSSLYFHHADGWQNEPARATAPFPAIRDHVLLRLASQIREEDAALAAALTPAAIDAVLDRVPEEWAIDVAPYRRYFLERLAAPRAFVEEAAGAR